MYLTIDERRIWNQAPLIPLYKLYISFPKKPSLQIYEIKKSMFPLESPVKLRVGYQVHKDFSHVTEIQISVPA